MNLFELDKEFRNAVAQVEFMAEQNDGEIDAGLEAEMDRLSLDRANKALNLAGYIKELSAEADMIKAQEKRLAEMRRVKENRADRLERYLAGILQTGEKLEAPWAKISWRKSSSLAIDDYAEIPESFFKIEKSPKIAEIKEAVKGGAVFEGVRLVDRMNLQIK